ncbi:MAG: MFS transporter [Anaerolinea sp.]|nr:MFS transporter [Anaerolinea sp.]
MTIPDTRTRNRLLLVLFIGVLMGALDIAIVGPALPAIQAGFGVDDRALAWVFTIYVLANLVGTPLMAKLSDRAGRRSIYVLDVALFAAGSLIVALSPTFGVLLVGRAIQGLGAGGIFPVASAVIGDTFPVEKRGSALGLIGAVFGIAFLIGPILGGVILLALNWHWLFLINLPIAAVLIVAALRLLPTTRPQEPRPFDWAGMIVLTALLTAMTYGMNQLDTANVRASLATPQVWGFLLLTVALVPVFVWTERRAVDPVLHLSLFTKRQMALVNLFAGLAGFAEAALVFVPALLVAAFAVSNSTASFMLLPVVLVMAIGSPLAGRTLDRTGSRTVVLIGTGVLAVGMLMVGLLPINMVLFYLAGALVGLGLSWLLGAPLRYIMLNEAPRSQRAASQAALALSTRVGQLAGGALVGAVAASMGGGVPGYQNAFAIIGGVSLAFAVLALALKSRSEELATVRRNEQAEATQSAT